MAALSFGNFGSSFDGSGAGFSLGTSVLKSPTDFQYRKAPVVKSPTNFQYAKPASTPLTFGSSVPKMSTGGTRLSYGTSIPKMSTTGFVPTSGGAGFGNFLKTLSLGSVVPTAPAAARSGSGLTTVPQIDTVTMAGGSSAADAAKNLASQIFGEMLQPAAFGLGSEDGAASGGQSGSFMDNIGFAEIAIGAIGLGVVFMLVSGGGSKRRRRG